MLAIELKYEVKVLSDVLEHQGKMDVSEKTYPLIHVFHRLVDSGHIKAVNASSRSGLCFLNPKLTQRGISYLNRSRV